MSRSHAVLLVATLGACTPGTSPHPITNTHANTTPQAPSLADTLAHAKAQGGDVLLVATADGIRAYTADLVLIAKLTSTPGRYLHADPQHQALFYFVDRRLVRLDLTTGQERTVATLPELRQACFGSGEDAVNPLDYVQRDEDIVVDVAHGFACLNVQDRNINMMSAAITYRVALDTGAVIHKTTFTLDECRVPGEPDRADGPCAAGELMPGPDLVSASKRWELVRDPDLGEQGDYIYSATLVTDRQTHKTYALRADGLAELDLAAARAAGKAPEGTCLLPFETVVRWFPHADTALVVGCSDAGALVVQPPATVRTIAGDAFAFY